MVSLLHLYQCGSDFRNHISHTRFLNAFILAYFFVPICCEHYELLSHLW